MKNWLGIKTKTNTLVFTNEHFIKAVCSVLKAKKLIEFISSNSNKIIPLNIKISSNFKGKKYRNSIVKMQRYFLFSRNGEYYICSNIEILKRDDVLISSNLYDPVETMKATNNAFYILRTIESGRYFILSTNGQHTPLRSSIQEVEKMAQKMVIFDDLLFNFNKLDKADKTEFLQQIVKIDIVQTIL